MKYLRYFEENTDILIGYNGHFNKTFTKTIGENATEGNGYYIANSLEFAKMFMNDKRTLLKITYHRPKKPLIPVVFDAETSFLGWSGEGEIWDNPVKKSDSDWIKFHKIAVKADVGTDETIKIFTELAIKAGYDSVAIAPESKDGWYVIFDDSLIINVVEITA